MRNLTSCICILGLSGVASAEVVMDQIGDMDGSGIGTNIMASQYFEASFAQYSIVLADNFSVTADTNITNVEMVLGGWNGFVDPSSVTAYEVNFYSSPDAAGSNLVGDVASNTIDAADATQDPNWTGANYLMGLPTAMVAPAGGSWVGVIPHNEFGTGGQTGCADSVLGDSTSAIQANPGGGFGFGPWQEVGADGAYRMNSDGVADPCASPLPMPCPEDLDGDGSVAIGDILLIIGDFGAVGDGTFRPAGDCAPLPNGDCATTITDLLAVVAAFGADCNVYGACCYDDGTCADGSTADDCAAMGGSYLGDNSMCSDGGCVAAACCVGTDCLMLTGDACTGFGGTWHDGYDCTSWDCTAATPGDECADAIEVMDGANAFDTSLMTPSTPAPEDMCPGTYFDWGESNDGWYMYTATMDGSTNFSTCDAASYDTSLALYEGSCDNQVACNGDSPNAGSCQPYFSEIDYATTAGTVYYLRIGAWNGDGQGPGTLTITPPAVPVSGACCIDDWTCMDDLMSDECVGWGGTFMGEGTVCDSVDCAAGAGGDECDNPLVANLGANAFSTVDATPSSPEPDETQCEGTFLEWGGSNDVWFTFTATNDGPHHFTTCDAASYDTSMVLYEGSCDNQVTCNGDSSGESGCQGYYSAFDWNCTAGTKYYVRLGGWQADSGAGTLTISFDDPSETAACCVMGDCVGEYTSADCAAAGGTWYQGDDCSTVACPQPACPGAQVSQNVHGIDDAWTAGTSTYDPTGGATYERAETVNLASMGDLTVWGLQLFYSGSWGACSTDYNFNIRGYDDGGGVPGTLTSESLNAPAVKTATGELYAGLYELMQWDMNHTATNVGWLSVQSASDGLNCWFLWMSSGIGDGDSAMNDGTGWATGQGFDLSLCIN